MQLASLHSLLVRVNERVRGSERGRETEASRKPVDECSRCRANGDEADESETEMEEQVLLFGHRSRTLGHTQ